MALRYPTVGQFKTSDDFQARLVSLGLEIPLDPAVLSADEGSPMSDPISLRSGARSLTIGNRWCIQPMEGWDAHSDGSPSELTLRRWSNFGRSGAKWIWGGEAAAVRPDGRANPRQTLAIPANQTGLRQLLAVLIETHRQTFGSTDGLVVGLQLTHSGRFCRPRDHRFEPRIAYHHPLLDPKVGIAPDDDTVVWTDDQIEALIDDYLVAARLAANIGFDFVDIKACHGYLLHEFLSAHVRSGKYGGDFAGRTRILRTIIERIHSEIPELSVMVRLSIFDSVPYQPSQQGSSPGQPIPFANWLPYRYGFGVAMDDPLTIDLREPLELLGMLEDIGVTAVNISCGSPYYNPHLLRPALFPPSDGYSPPEDPLVGVARQIQTVRICKQAYPNLPMVGSGYTYLQDFLPHVAQGVIRAGWVDAVGLGRMVLSYPQLPADTLSGKPMRRKQICRTFSDCTTGPRNGLVSGCFPLDPHYKQMDEATQLKAIKSSHSSS